MALFEQIKKSGIPLKSLFTISIIINVVIALVGLTSTFILPPEIPLFYGMPKNDSQLVPSFMIILPSLITLILTIFNLILAIKLNGQYIKKALAFTSISLTLLNIIATLKIIFLVGSF